MSTERIVIKVTPRVIVKVIPRRGTIRMMDPSTRAGGTR